MRTRGPDPWRNYLKNVSLPGLRVTRGRWLRALSFYQGRNSRYAAESIRRALTAVDAEIESRLGEYAEERPIIPTEPLRGFQYNV